MHLPDRNLSSSKVLASVCRAGSPSSTAANKSLLIDSSVSFIHRVTYCGILALMNDDRRALQPDKKARVGTFSNFSYMTHVSLNRDSSETADRRLAVFGPAPVSS